jgi:antitoxin ParD1/3/4
VPTRNVSLTAEQDAFIERIIQAGEYQNASEAIRDALRVLQQKRREDALKLRALRAQIKAGLDALERGDFTEIAEGHLDEYVEGLAENPGKASRWIQMARFRLSLLAQADLARILATRAEHWGIEGRQRYDAMFADV